MGIFDLPPIEKRKYNNLFLHKGSVVRKAWVKEKDFYLVHRVGVTMTYWALMLGGIAFVLSCAHRFYGTFPDMSVLYDISIVQNSSPDPKPKLLDIFNGLINWVGRILFIMLFYYFVIFLKNINFRKYNILRYGHVTSTRLGFKSWISLLILPFIALFCLVFIGSAFNIFLAYKSLLLLVDSVSFVFIIYLFSVFFLGVIAQIFFLFSITLVYIFYERVIYHE